MSVGVLLVTHGNLGSELLNTAETMLGICPLQTRLLSIDKSVDIEVARSSAEEAYQSLNSGEGVLVLTDIYGSTPSNIANSLLNHKDVSVVAGVNLPMLIRVMNYPALDLREMVIKAISGGHDGILFCNEMKAPQ
jgi:PTS system ascorbate-specific IIA component